MVGLTTPAPARLGSVPCSYGMNERVYARARRDATFVYRIDRFADTAAVHTARRGGGGGYCGRSM